MRFYFSLLIAVVVLCLQSSEAYSTDSGRGLKFSCDPGYFNDNGSCVECATDFCKVCQPPNGKVCTQCIAPYTLNHATGECEMLGNPPGVQAPPGNCDYNCAVCNNPPTCQNCKVGYFNDNGTCKKCTEPNCQVCQPPTGDTCTQCVDPYVLDHATGKCEMPSGRKLASSGEECVGDMECSWAARGLSQSNGCNASVSFCLKCAQPNTCQNCELGYFNDNGKCVKCKTQNCQVCQPPDGAQCTQCLRPYTINHATGECDSNGNTPPNPGNDPCGPYCAVCPNNGPYCQNCEQGYWNDNGYCKMCQTYNCRVCQPDNGATCTQCLDGYSLKGNNCVAQ